MPRLSIVIPWIGPTGPFEDTLAAVLQNRPGGCEVIVALSRPYDDPHALSCEVEFLPPARGVASFVALVNRAIEVAAAPVVQVIPCGYSATDSWTSAALLHFDDADVAAVAPAVLTSARRTRVLSAGVEPGAGGTRKESQRGAKYNVVKLAATTPSGAPLAGGFFRKSVVEALGGFDETLGEGLADLDLAVCLGELDLRVECEPTSVLLAQRVHYRRRGRFGEGVQAERLFWRHTKTDGDRAALQHRCLRIAAELGWSLLQPWWLAHAAGRLMGRVQAHFYRSHAERMAQARELLATELSPPDVLRMPSRAAAGQRRRAA